MYYKKYFSGLCDATSTTNLYWMGLDKEATTTSMVSGHIKNRSDVIGNALVSTLHDVGYTNAYWDTTAGYLFIDKTNSLCGFYIDVQSSYIYTSTGVQRPNYSYLLNSFTSMGTSTSSGYRMQTSIAIGTTPFSTTGYGACGYGFYVSVVGEPTGLMFINIGAYLNQQLGYINLIVGKGIDKRDNSNTYILYMATGSNGFPTSISNFSVQTYNAENTLLAYQTALGTNTLYKTGVTLVLIPVFFKYAYCMIDNTYFNPGLDDVGFYEIGGDVYYVTRYYMTKCVTEI